MNSEEEIFAAAAALPVVERAACLDAACAGQPELRARVEALLRSHEVTGFMEEGTAVVGGESLAEQTGERIGRYRLLQQIGEGGFGSVWMAEQVEPVTRRVALKIIKAGMDTREVIARFEAERQALAMMDHPNIAKVFDAGATDKGRPFFVMELVKGIPITKFCDEREFTTRQRLELFADVCSAINHAHQKGVIHRDIKPSNVMVTLHCDKPVAKVIDFGVAKATQGRLTDKTLFTRFEQFVGTPAYMSPEQSALGGLDVDTRSDIYALGVLLYELLTGKPPFDSKTLLSAGYEEMCRIIREVEPPKPSTRLKELLTVSTAADPPDKSKILNPKSSIAPDLDWIVMKAIEKDRTRRYETANGLALDIQRYLANEPVSAAAPGVVYLFRKFARRHRTALSLAALIAVVLVAATGISLWQAELALTAKRQTADALHEVEKQKADVDRKNAEQRAMLAEAAQSDRAIADGMLRAGLEREAFAHLARACEYEPLSTFAAQKAVGALNTWQHPVPATILTGYQDIILTEHFSPSGLNIVTASRDRNDTEVFVWDASTGKCLSRLAGHEDRIWTARFSPDGTRIVTASRDNTARVWNVLTSNCVVTLAQEDDVVSAQFSPDGARILTLSANKTARVWDTVTGKCLAVLAGHEDFAWDIAHFSPDGSRIVIASRGKTVKVWDAATGQSVLQLEGHEAYVSSAQFSPDGSLLATSSKGKTARVWDATTGKCLLNLTGHEATVASAQFSPDGSRILTASSDKTARVWEAATGKHLTTLAGHDAVILSAQFSPNGAHILTVSADKTARVWDATTGKCLATLAGHEDIIRTARFSPDGSRIVTVSGNTARVWEAIEGDYPLTLTGHEAGLNNAHFNRDGSRLVTASKDNTAQVWDAATGLSLLKLVGHEAEVGDAQFSPDGSRLVTASKDKTVRMWDAATGNCLITLGSYEFPVRSAQFSHDSSRLVTASGLTVQVWDVATGKLLAVLPRPEFPIRTVQFSPDDSRIVTASGYTAQVWDTVAGIGLATLAGHQDFVWSARFSPDGARIVTTAEDMTARVWDAATGKCLVALTETARSAQFSPDGARIVTAVEDMTARVWDAGTGKCLVTLIGHESNVSNAQFSPDGSLIVTESRDNTARVWDASTGKRLATFVGPKGGLVSTGFSPDGSHIFTAAADGSVSIWNILPTTSGPPPAWFANFLRYMAQMRLNSEGELETLKPADWLALRERLRATVRESTGQDTPYLRILRRYVPE